MRKTVMFVKAFMMAAIVIAVAFAYVVPADAAGVVVYKEGEKHIKIGGRLQLQYHFVDPDGGESSDSVFFRRLRPYIMGSIHKDWDAKIQWDIGKADGENEVAIKEAWFKYKGYNNLTIRVGNSQFPFSREDITSSKKQNLVERTFVGDHSYGTPERNAGVFVAGHNEDKMITYEVAATSAAIDPDSKKLDFDTPINKNDDFNEGWLVGGRIDYHPWGNLKFSQGDFSDGALKGTISLAAFVWSNDDDNNTYTDASGNATGSKPDVDSVTGFEISGAVRWKGLSVDAEYNIFDADTIDGDFDGGIYEDGNTDLSNFSIEGGYMVMPKKLEFALGYQSQDTDTYADAWTRTSVGANYFWQKHDIKTQLTYRMGQNLNGVTDADQDELFLQFQFVF